MNKKAKNDNLKGQQQVKAQKDDYPNTSAM